MGFCKVAPPSAIILRTPCCQAGHTATEVFCLVLMSGSWVEVPEHSRCQARVHPRSFVRLNAQNFTQRQLLFLFSLFSLGIWFAKIIIKAANRAASYIGMGLLVACLCFGLGLFH